MTTYEFTLVLDGIADQTEDVARRLHAAGCNDATPWSHGGELSVDFARRGSSLQGAIASAIRDVQSAGLVVERVSIAAVAFPSGTANSYSANPPVHRFSIIELFAVVTAITVGFAFPVILPCVAILILIRAGLGLLQSVFIAILVAIVILAVFSSF